ncbi:unnamed protein product, partial [Didymodactylos carnosus]
RRENGTAPTVPVFDAWKSTLYTIRNTILSPIPTSLSSIVIPQDIYSIWIRISNKTLSENHHWNADGTFRTSPALFSQAYYIHVWDEYSMKPTVYACCEDKSQNGYTCLLRSLVSYAAQKNIVLSPPSISIDFEKAAINDVFPQTLVKGCHFHYAQNVWEKVKKYGLVKLAKQENIRRQIANIISLPLVPKDQINHCMEVIIDELCNADSKFDKLTDYILNNYTEDARFSFDMRNHFDSTGERPRTNTDLEGYHKQLNARVRTNPDL